MEDKDKQAMNGFVHGSTDDLTLGKAHNTTGTATSYEADQKALAAMKDRNELSPTAAAALQAMERAQANPNVVNLETLDPMMQFFSYQHLPPRLQGASKLFHDVAANIVLNMPRNPERTVALRKLLEAKDAGVRCILFRAPMPERLNGA